MKYLVLILMVVVVMLGFETMRVLSMDTQGNLVKIMESK